GLVVGAFDVAGGVAYFGGQGARVPCGEVGGRAGEGEVVGRAGDDVEGGRVGGERAGAGGDRDRAREYAGDCLGDDAAGGGRRPEPGDTARAVRLGEADARRVVTRLEVAGRVADLNGEGARVR